MHYMTVVSLEKSDEPEKRQNYEWLFYEEVTHTHRKARIDNQQVRAHVAHSIIPEATYSSYVRQQIKSKKSALSPAEMKQM